MGCVLSSEALHDTSPAPAVTVGVGGEVYVYVPGLRAPKYVDLREQLQGSISADLLLRLQQLRSQVLITSGKNMPASKSKRLRRSHHQGTVRLQFETTLPCGYYRLHPTSVHCRDRHVLHLFKCICTPVATDVICSQILEQCPSGVVVEQCEIFDNNQMHSRQDQELFSNGLQGFGESNSSPCLCDTLTLVCNVLMLTCAVVDVQILPPLLIWKRHL